MMNQLFMDLKQQKLHALSPFQFKKNITSMRQLHKLQMRLKSINKSEHTHRTYKASDWLYKLQIKHQIIILTIILISIVAGIQITINQIHFGLFASLLSNGFNQILQQQNQNFQASIMIKYMSLTRIYFYNNQQILLAINQMYNYGLKSQYHIDKGIECPVSRQDGKYPSYTKIDQFCYDPQASLDLQTFQNSTLNTEFVKLTNLLNEFILCFGFHLSQQIKNQIQINIDNEEEMVSAYPQGQVLVGYSPRQRPFFIFQKQQYQQNTVKEFYISKYLKWFNIQGGTLYGQALTVSLLNGTQFQGVIAVTIQFTVFDQIFYKFPDVNLALIADDGTILYQQNQFQIYNQQDYIYNQSSTGYNYEDWIILSSHKDYTKQLIMYNMLFPEPININIKKFNDLPYYFIVYNNLTYEKQIKTIQASIFNKITHQFDQQIYLLISIFISTLIACYFLVQFIIKPIIMIQKLIYCHNETFKDFNNIRQYDQSDNLLVILLLVIYFKYSELQNLSFKKSLQCQQIENLTFPYKQNINLENQLILYLQQQQQQINCEEKMDQKQYEYSFISN